MTPAMNKPPDDRPRTRAASLRATLEGDCLDEDHALVLNTTPQYRLEEGDTIVVERGDGTRTDLYVEGTSERGDVQVVLGVLGRYVGISLRFSDYAVAYPIIPESAKELIAASRTENGSSA